MTRRATPPAGYTNHPAKREVTWTPVVNPQPVFDGPADKARYEAAVASAPRLEGEDICAWLERVGRSARPRSDQELPAGDREPGEEG